MRTEDFSDGLDGYCCTSTLDGEEFILSQQFTGGTEVVGMSVRKIAHELREIPTISMRYGMLQMGIETEMKGMRLTGKGRSCSAIVKHEYGVSKNLSKKKTLLAFQLLLQLGQMLYKEQKESEEE